MAHQGRRITRSRSDGLGEVLFELIPMGSVVKVSAIDPVTGTEVCLVGDPHLSSYSLRAAARRKLAYVVARNRSVAPSTDPAHRRGDRWA